MRMPAQILLVQEYEKLQSQFVICDSCFWCATSIGAALCKCPACGSRLNAIQLNVPSLARCTTAA